MGHLGVTLTIIALVRTVHYKKEETDKLIEDAKLLEKLRLFC
jgi:hypothetical protein